MYKVTRRMSDTKGCSVNASLLSSPLCRYYEVGKLVKAWKGSPGIFFFKELDDAVFFARHWISPDPTMFLVFSVEPIGGVRKATQADIIVGTLLKRVKIWNDLRKLMKWWLHEKDYTGAVPAGSMVAPAVKVIGIVSTLIWCREFYRSRLHPCIQGS